MQIRLENYIVRWRMDTSLPDDPRPTWDKAVERYRSLVIPERISIFDHLRELAEAIRTSPLSRVAYYYPGVMSLYLGLVPYRGPQSMTQYPIFTAMVSRLAPSTRFVLWYTDVRGVDSERLERALPDVMAMLEGWLL